MKCS